MLTLKSPIRHHRDRGGVTMLDMVLTITLMGIAAAISVPRLGESVSRMRLRSAAATVVADFEYLRRQAIVQGRNVVTNIDLATNTISSPDAPLPGRPLLAYSRNLAEQMGVTAMLFPEDHSASITFDRRGEIWDSSGLLQRWVLALRVGNQTAEVMITPTTITSQLGS
ncbi:pilus assembly FimT family protein [Planctomycetaceae bacterium SH139]